MGWLASIRSAFAGTLAPLSSGGGGGWTSIVIREPSTGAWQRNEEITIDSSLNHPAVFACTSLISSDIGKVRLRLVAETSDGIWEETRSPAFSPVLRKPNRYQTIVTFIEQWLVSKLTHGNTYVLKQRDQRNVVIALYVLDPTRITPLVAADGGVYYQLDRDDLTGLTAEQIAAHPIVPASEIIHDRYNCFFHPLCGLSPIFACGLAALQGLKIQENSERFFANGSNPGGVILVPGKIGPDTAQRISQDWTAKYSGPNIGKVALLTEGMRYEPIGVNASDAQLLEQLQWTVATICSCYHVPASLIDSSIQAPYGNNPEPLIQLYYSQCLQSLMNALELLLDEGLELPAPYGTEFDVDDLIWFDTATRTKAAHDTILSGSLSPDEARKKYFGVGKVTGGDTPYLQQQMYSLRALAERDAGDPFAPPPPAPVVPPALPPADDEAEDEADGEAAFLAVLHQKSAAAGWISDAP